jgi:hypothetical protein
MLCALGALSFAAVAADRWPRRVAVFAGLALGSVLTFDGQLPDAVLTASAVAAVSAIQLFRPGARLLTACCAGVLGALWVALLQAQGVPSGAGLAIVSGLLTATLYLAVRRPAFAPRALRDDALVLMLIGGVVVAAAPSVLDGWRAAFNLSVGERGTAVQIPGWIVMFVTATVLGGGAYSLWSRR